jgi:hypothetical protein
MAPLSRKAVAGPQSGMGIAWQPMKHKTKGLLIGVLAGALFGLEGGFPSAQALSRSQLEASAIGQEANLLSKTGQRRSDRVVGFWRSSSGVELTLAYTGRPETLMIQVYPSANSAQPNLLYTATWISDSQFVYLDAEGSRITAQVHPTGRRITVRGVHGWSAEWLRKN